MNSVTEMNEEYVGNEQMKSMNEEYMGMNE